MRPAPYIQGMHPVLRSATPRRLIALGALITNVGFYLPRVPSPGGSSALPLDKLVHALVFALTVWALGRLLAPPERYPRRFPIGWVAVLAIVHAVVIEVVQSLALASRSGDVRDVVADLIGVAIGLLAWWLERRPGSGRAAAVTSPADGSRRRGSVPSPR